MLTKTVFIVLLATLSVSYAKDEQAEFVRQVLSTGTNIMKEFSKVVADDADKYSVDLNSLYKKYDIAAKADKARSYLKIQFKKEVESYIDNLKKGYIKREEKMKEDIEIIKRQDPVLGDLLYKQYEKVSDSDRTNEKILRYLTDVDRINDAFENYSKNTLNPMFRKWSDAVKLFEAAVLENIPKKGKQ